MGRRAFVRDNILEAALTLFAREGYEAVSTRDIAKTADVGHASMYRHFPTKEDLGRELYRRAVAPLIHRLCQHLADDNPALAAAAFTQALYDAYDAYPKALALLIFPPHEFIPDQCDHNHPDSLRSALRQWFDRGPPEEQAVPAADRAALLGRRHRPADRPLPTPTPGPNARPGRSNYPTHTTLNSGEQIMNSHLYRRITLVATLAAFVAACGEVEKRRRIPSHPLNRPRRSRTPARAMAGQR